MCRIRATQFKGLHGVTKRELCELTHNYIFILAESMVVGKDDDYVNKTLCGIVQFLENAPFTNKKDSCC
eukprot:CCRYP_008850-RA/>CCRYP_008850-RA protein AED:0.28 eAED:0.28 QI:20/1/1/1/0/0/2/54/68